MTSSAIRQSFLDFFKEKQHTIVPSSSLLPDSPNLLFTNAGMNQFVPIFLGQTPCPYSPARAADTQKCIRAGGKHNDLEDVGFDTYHHTFFEMLGNWSFGNYFKKEAIEWAWELVVGRWNFPASRLYATVYSPGDGDPASFDREAHEHWSEIFIAAGLDPAYHVVHGNKKDNFWMMGDTGPCGPCSELHVNLLPGPRDLDFRQQIEGRNLVNKGDSRCIEIWNLVFIQFNANPDGSFVDLPARHVDTGMGFERVTSMIQGTKGLTDFSESEKISNYETDVFRPIFDELEKLTGHPYRSTLPNSAQDLTEQEKIDVAFRVIADHIRTLSFSIADGIQPSNEGRGYVLRRILRRAVKYGRNLGLKEPFLGKLVDVLGKTMGHIFPDVVAKAEYIRKTLRNEEESFLRTLERGIDLFESVILSLSKDHPPETNHGCPIGLASPPNPLYPGLVEESFPPSPANPEGRGQDKKNVGANRDAPGELILRQAQDDGIAGSKVFPGADAFRLSDTYGFPLDLTELMARERGLTVDVSEFSRLMEEQKARSRDSQKKEVILMSTGSTGISATSGLKAIRADERAPTKFVGFDHLVAVNAEVVEIIAGAEDSLLFSTKLTPFYAQMGGQVGDTGLAMIGEKGGTVFPVFDVQKSEGSIYWHKSKASECPPLQPGLLLHLTVEKERRQRIEAHHSGTHVLNWALRKVLGTTIGQKGSYVGPDRLRFDFSHGAALTPAELVEVERLVNEKIVADVPASWEERPYAEVKGDPNILQAFGDKYGEVVRVVSIGDFSKELCGGTHVRQSGKIGYFKIISEGAIAAGIRRIEAVSGAALMEYVMEHLDKQDAQHAQLKLRKPDLAPLPTVAREQSAEAMWQLYAEREVALKEGSSAVAQYEKDAAKHQEAAFQKRAAETAPDLIASSREIKGVPFLAVEIADAPAAYLPFLADAIKTRWQGVAVLGTVDQGKVSLLAAVAPAYVKKIQAGKIIQTIAPLVGGKGGGRPELAQGGGTNPGGLAEALAKAGEFVGSL